MVHAGLAMEVHTADSGRSYYDTHHDLPLPFVSTCPPYGTGMTDNYGDVYCLAYSEEDALIQQRSDIIGSVTNAADELSSMVGQRDYRLALLGTSNQVSNINGNCGLPQGITNYTQRVSPPLVVGYNTAWQSQTNGSVDSTSSITDAIGNIPTTPSSHGSSSHRSGSSTTSCKPKRRRVQTSSQRKAANVRERRRMFHLNEAFDELRKRLPAFTYEKRLSRIETLRLAMTYIGFMKDVTSGKDPCDIELQKYKTCDSPEGCDIDEDDEQDDDNSIGEK